MEGLLVAWVVMFFSYHDDFSDITVSCVLVNWFLPKGRDGVTGLWVAGKNSRSKTCSSHSSRVNSVDALDAFRTSNRLQIVKKNQEKNTRKATPMVAFSLVHPSTFTLSQGKGHWHMTFPEGKLKVPSKICFIQ